MTNERKIELIQKHLDGWQPGTRKFDSIKKYAQTGKVSGRLYLAIREMLEEAMKEYGEQCFNAAREKEWVYDGHGNADEKPKYETFEDYLKSNP